MSFPTMITDRDQSDLSNNNAKAFHNRSDLLRINAACIYLSDVLNQAGLSNEMTLNTIWDEAHDLAEETPEAIAQILSYTSENLDAVLNNVRLLRSFFSFGPYTPEVPLNFNKPTLEKANDIEMVLQHIYELGDFFLVGQTEIFQTAQGEAFLYSMQEVAASANI